MSVWLYVGLGIGGGFILLALIYFFILKGKKKEEHPVLLRAKELNVMLTQRIHTLNRRIQQLDTEVTELLIVKDKEDLSLTKLEIALEDVPKRIESNKEEIRVSIADIEDLKEYEKEIKQIINQKEEIKWDELEKLLDLVKDKMKYRFT
jgi:chromosome segregation ATPase